MKNMNYFMKFILGLILVSGITAQMLVCQDGNFLSEDNLTCECETKMFYDAYEGKCEDICSYYGNSLCGYYANSVCINYIEQDPTNFTCECLSGFESSNNPNTGVKCIDELEQCDKESPCSDELNEDCVDLFGTYACVCKEFFYRNKNGDCAELNMCNLPNNHTCEHICKNGDEPGEYTCECNTGYVLNETDQYSCILDENTETCTCKTQNNEWSSCAHSTNNNTHVCEPLAGYEENDNKEIQDINECEDENIYQCPQYSVCVNFDGSYACNCIEDYGWNDTLKECTRKTCPAGSALYNHECYVICYAELGPQCPYDTVCLVDENNVPFCDCPLFCQMNGNRNKVHSLYAYELHFTLGYERFNGHPKDEFRITKSFESIFGRGNVQIISYYNDLINLAIGLQTPLSNVKELADIVSNMCYVFDHYGTTPKCVLPGNIVANKNDFTSSDLYPCDYYPDLCNKNSECLDSRYYPSILPGNYVCKCQSGFQQENDLEEVYCVDIDECENDNSKCPNGYQCLNLINYFYCADIDECYNANETNCAEDTYCVNTRGSYTCVIKNTTPNCTDISNEITETRQELEDEEHKTKVVFGVLGSFFALAVILLGIALFYIHKMKT